ncbi:hypothetical protein [Sorangium cellulosum]|uniref:hypothetical protein n=1 Tax=Sorangium cellulosum TaxID=56 RepID=UPI0016515DB2|nr:hypothetical protein [Sorangium cellulosum]
MIGLLGTFLGLFETLRGAREALTLSADVDALRESLAAPMQGLSRAFGTSAAGVSGSAMLGLGAVLVRRAEAGAAAALHAYAAGPLAALTVAGRQLAALEALARQGEALPAAAASLREATSRLERLEERLVAVQVEGARQAAASFAAVGILPQDIALRQGERPVGPDRAGNKDEDGVDPALARVFHEGRLLVHDAGEVLVDALELADLQHVLGLIDARGRRLDLRVEPAALLEAEAVDGDAVEDGAHHAEGQPQAADLHPVGVQREPDGGDGKDQRTAPPCDRVEQEAHQERRPGDGHQHGGPQAGLAERRVPEKEVNGRELDQVPARDQDALAEPFEVGVCVAQREEPPHADRGDPREHEPEPEQPDHQVPPVLVQDRLRSVHRHQALHVRRLGGPAQGGAHDRAPGRADVGHLHRRLVAARQMQAAGHQQAQDGRVSDAEEVRGRHVRLRIERMKAGAAGAGERRDERQEHDADGPPEPAAERPLEDGAERREGGDEERRPEPDAGRPRPGGGRLGSAPGAGGAGDPPRPRGPQGHQGPGLLSRRRGWKVRRSGWPGWWGRRSSGWSVSRRRARRRRRRGRRSRTRRVRRGRRSRTLRVRRT